jgi:hypothetical protein
VSFSTFKGKFQKVKNTKLELKLKKGEIEMNYSLRKLQAAYLKVTLGKQEQTEETCLYCWKSGCGCSDNKAQNDPFINLTTMSEFQNV